MRLETFNHPPLCLVCPFDLHTGLMEQLPNDDGGFHLANQRHSSESSASGTNGVSPVCWTSGHVKDQTSDKRCFWLACGAARESSRVTATGSRIRKPPMLKISTSMSCCVSSVDGKNTRCRENHRGGRRGYRYLTDGDGGEAPAECNYWHPSSLMSLRKRASRKAENK